MAEEKRKPGRPPGSKNKKTGGGSTSKGATKNGAAAKKRTQTTGESKAKARAMEIQAERRADQRVVDEIWAIIAIAVGIFLVIATFTGGAGQFGKLIGDVLKGVLGFIAYLFPFYIILYGILLFGKKTVHISLKSGLLIFSILLMMTTMNAVRFIDVENIDLSLKAIQGFYSSGVTLKSGGFLGMLVASLLMKWFGTAGCWIFSIVVTIVCLLLLINTPVSRFIGKIGDKIEERRLIEEHAHLDYLEEEDGQQIAMHEEPLTDSGKGQSGLHERASFFSRSREKKRGKVMNSSVIEEDRGEKPKADGQGDAEAAQYAGEMNTLSKKEIPVYGLTDFDDEPSYVPPSEESRPPRDKKERILQYMQDDHLFDRQPMDSVGLEEKLNYGQGFGLDECRTSASVSTAGSGVEKNVIAFPTGETPAAQPPQKLSKKESREAMLTAEELAQNQKPVKVYHMPPINLLTRSSGAVKTNNKALQAKAMKLEETLKNFHVDAKVVQVTQGPTVTRYEIQPAVGVKVSSIVRLSDDIALNLEARSIRIEAPIPGKAAVGIEVENDAVSMVKLRDIIESKAFRDAKSKITFTVGKDISGNAIVADLKSMPHLLIAGSTGSGKSVCINSIILSVLYKATPDEVKLILIDPKVVELGNYNGIPHLLIPVVTDPSKAAAALNWAVAEMTDRYKKFAETGVRDLESYNEAMKADGEEEKVLPQVVIIIDELADLMMAAPSQIEESICRLAQMARAAGMHLIVATQRPSVDVITGVIKANIPSRIAFAVSSQVDSRTILDMQGAEKLVGKGDMLFYPMGMGKPIRVQGAFVSDGEVHDVIQYIKGQVDETTYSEEILTKIERTGNAAQGEEADDLLPEAIDLVVKSGQASVSMLQRRFRIGYNRAARIVDMMEARGIIGPQDGSRPRQVLMTEEELAQLKEEKE